MQNISRKVLFTILALFVFSFLFHALDKVQAASITYVQSTLANTSSPVNSLSATFGSAVGNGNLVVVAISSWNSSNTASITSVTDNKGNTYAKVLENGTGATEPLSVWYAQNVVGGSSFSVTAYSNSNASLMIAIHEYSGVDTVSALDSSANTNATGTSAYSGNTPAHVSGEILFGAFNFIDNTSSVSGTSGSGFTLRQKLTDKHTYEAIFTEDRVVSSVAPYQATLTFNRAVTWRGAVVAFKPKGVPSPTPTLPSTLTSTPTQSPAPTGTSSPSPTPGATASPTLKPTLPACRFCAASAKDSTCLPILLYNPATQSSSDS